MIDFASSPECQYVVVVILYSKKPLPKQYACSTQSRAGLRVSLTVPRPSGSVCLQLAESPTGERA